MGLNSTVYMASSIISLCSLAASASGKNRSDKLKRIFCRKPRYVLSTAALMLRVKCRVTIRPAFCFSQTEQFDYRCSNFNIGQAGHNDMWSDLQKKKKRSTPVWLQDLCSFRPENDTNCAAEQVLTFFFFFFWRSPLFPFFRIKSTTEFERPDFVLKIIEKPINLASCKVAIHCFLLFQIW